jgi:hypothetical protein
MAERMSSSALAKSLRIRCGIADDAIEVTIPMGGFSVFIATQVDRQIHASIAEHARNGVHYDLLGMSYNRLWAAKMMCNIAHLVRHRTNPFVWCGRRLEGVPQESGWHLPCIPNRLPESQWRIQSETSIML